MKSPSLVLFKNPWLDRLTKVHPLVPALFWISVVVVIVQHQERLQALADWGRQVYLFVFGLLIWSLFEYGVHRWIFHRKARARWEQNLVYLFHLNHHEQPSDWWRGLMPITASSILSLPIFLIFWGAFQTTKSGGFMIGFIVGYLVYDYLHFSFHHQSWPFSWWQRLRKRHLRHHSKGDLNFGVSSGLWDWAFKTRASKTKRVELQKIHL